jgi:hypothetical protein
VSPAWTMPPACWIVAHGAADVPAFESLPVLET